MYEKFLEGDLIVSEGEGIGHMLHLRVIGKEGPNFESLNANALCDAPLAWDTHIPVNGWMETVQGNSNCALCLMLAEYR